MAHGKTAADDLADGQLRESARRSTGPLRFESWVETVDGEKFSVRGHCFHGDVKVSEAEALILGTTSFPW